MGFFIYKITCVVNGKIYIGYTTRPRKRWLQHVAISLRGPTDRLYKVIHRAIAKYGKDNFTFEIIEELKTEQEMFAAEARWIKQLNSTNRKIGYNLDPGGKGRSGYKASAKTKCKLRAARAKQIWHRKSTNDTISDIRRKFATGQYSFTSLAKEYSLSRGTISRIVKYQHTYAKDFTDGCFIPHTGKRVAPEIVKSIRYKYVSGGFTYKQLAKEYGLHERTIFEIVKFKRTYANDIHG